MLETAAVLVYEGSSPTEDAEDSRPTKTGEQQQESPSSYESGVAAPDPQVLVLEGTN